MNSAWAVYKNRVTGKWRAQGPGYYEIFTPKFDTWRHAYDFAFTEATRELSDR